jgi:hypothetical protein
MDYHFQQELLSQQMEMVWNNETDRARPSKTMNTQDDAVRWPEFG